MLMRLMRLLILMLPRGGGGWSRPSTITKQAFLSLSLNLFLSPPPPLLITPLHFPHYTQEQVCKVRVRGLELTLAVVQQFSKKTADRLNLICEPLNMQMWSMIPPLNWQGGLETRQVFSLWAYSRERERERERERRREKKTLAFRIGIRHATEKPLPFLLSPLTRTLGWEK